MVFYDYSDGSDYTEIFQEGGLTFNSISNAANIIEQKFKLDNVTVKSIVPLEYERSRDPHFKERKAFSKKNIRAEIEDIITDLDK
jgi:hypothetical protein